MKNKDLDGYYNRLLQRKDTLVSSMALGLAFVLYEY